MPWTRKGFARCPSPRPAEPPRTTPVTCGGSPPDALVYVGQRFRGTSRTACTCPLDTLIVGTEVTTLTVDGSTATAVPGTELATGVAPILDGSAILYTLPNDTRIYRRTLASGEVTVVARLRARGDRAGRARGGQPSRRDRGRKGGVLGGPAPGPGAVGQRWGAARARPGGRRAPSRSTRLGRLYRRPALSPDGSRIVAEGYPLIITQIGGWLTPR